MTFNFVQNGGLCSSSAEAVQDAVSRGVEARGDQEACSVLHCIERRIFKGDISTHRKGLHSGIRGPPVRGTRCAAVESAKVRVFCGTHAEAALGLLGLFCGRQVRLHVRLLKRESTLAGEGRRSLAQQGEYQPNTEATVARIKVPFCSLLRAPAVLSVQYWSRATSSCRLVRGNAISCACFVV